MLALLSHGTLRRRNTMSLQRDYRASGDARHCARRSIVEVKPDAQNSRPMPLWQSTGSTIEIPSAESESEREEVQTTSLFAYRRKSGGTICCISCVFIARQTSLPTGFGSGKRPTVLAAATLRNAGRYPGSGLGRVHGATQTTCWITDFRASRL